MDKSLRSVFVGNIPYEATEEKLKDIFSEVGQVVTFKLVYDRETGKPKGYGFCEYEDQETALSAMRNLNGVEIAGRTLRVDNACTEKSRMEIQSLMAEPVTESPFGPPCEPGRAPDVVSKAVASLPPEQMFQLMQQMKQCIQNNPHEARTMLLQNPQLAYALLQAQVVMKIVDPETAVTMLHKPTAPAPPVGGGYGGGRSGPSNVPTQQTNFGPPFPGAGGNFGMDLPRMDMHGPPQEMNGPPRGGMPSRGMDPTPRLGLDHGGRGGSFPPEESRGPQRDPRDPRSRDPRGDRDPRSMGRGPPNNGPQVQNNMRLPPSMGPGPGGPPQSQMPPHIAGVDPEKARLINEVLQLSDEQIAGLPAEQRQSIIVLKEQMKHGNMR